MRPRIEENDKTTACYVHSLIAGEWAAPPHNLKDNENVVHETRNADEPVALVKPPFEENGRVSVTDVGDPRTLKPAPTIIQSRHLTKRQLSDMAWNVRKLSKKLGSIKLKLTVKNVFVVCKAHDESLVSLTRKLTRWLLSRERDTPYVVYVEQRLQTHPDFGELQLLEEEPSAKGRLKYWDPQLAQDQPHLFDFVITLGGDGTVLYTSWLFQRIVPPVLSFALGSLGFLTNFDFVDYKQTLETAFRDGVVVSLRLRFECTIMRSKARSKDPLSSKLARRDLVEELIGEEGEDTLTHTPDRVYEILNDVVLDRGPNPSLSLFPSLLGRPLTALLLKLCRILNCLATTNTSRLSSQMESALLPRRDQPLTILLRAVRSLTRRIRSSSLRPSARILCPFGRLSYQTPSSCAWVCPTMLGRVHGLASMVVRGEYFPTSLA